jgi:hypothetical protein
MAITRTASGKLVAHDSWVSTTQFDLNDWSKSNAALYVNQGILPGYYNYLEVNVPYSLAYGFYFVRHVDIASRSKVFVQATGKWDAIGGTYQYYQGFTGVTAHHSESGAGLDDCAHASTVYQDRNTAGNDTFQVGDFADAVSTHDSQNSLTRVLAETGGYITGLFVDGTTEIGYDYTDDIEISRTSAHNSGGVGLVVRGCAATLYITYYVFFSFYAFIDRYITVGNAVNGHIAKVLGNSGAVLAQATVSGGSATIDMLPVKFPRNGDWPKTLAIYESDGTTLVDSLVPTDGVWTGVWAGDVYDAGAAVPPTAGEIEATATDVGEITVSEVTPPTGATSRALYGADAAADLPAEGPGAGAELLDADWDGSDVIESGLGYGVTRYYAEYATNEVGTVRSNIASATTSDPRPGEPSIIVTITGPGQFTITVTPGSAATDHQLYAQEDSATGLFDPANLALAELGAAPDPIVVDGFEPGSTWFFGLRASNEYGTADSDPASGTIPEAQLAVALITYQSATLYLTGAAFATQVRYQTTLASDTGYLDPIDNVTLTDSSRFSRPLADLTAATSLRSREQHEVETVWSEWLEITWATVAAPADTSEILHPINGEPIDGFYCIQLELAAGRSVDLIEISDDNGATWTELPVLCFDSTAFADGWYNLRVTTDLSTELESLFRIDNALRVGDVTCEEAVGDGIRAGDTSHIWTTANVLAAAGLGCTVEGYPDTSCHWRTTAPTAYLLLPTGPSGTDLTESASQRISAFMALDPYCTAPIAFYPHFGQELMQCGLATHVSARPAGGWWGVRAEVAAWTFTPHSPPAAQALHVHIMAPGHENLSPYSVAFPAPVLVPWLYYDYAQPGSSIGLDLDVRRTDPVGSTYQIRVWAAGELMFDQTFVFDAPLPPGLPGLSHESWGGAAHWAGIQLYDSCTSDVIHVTRVRRLEVWDEVASGVTAAGTAGKVLAYIPEIISIEDERELMDDERLRCLLVHGSPGTEHIVAKRVLRTIYLDFTWEEWRIEKVTDSRLEDGSLVLEVEAVGIIFDLAHGRVQQVQANGNVDTDFDPPAMELTDHISGLILSSPGIKSHFAEGELAVVEPVEISYQGDCPLSAVRALAAAAEVEYHVVRGCNKYLITMPEEIGAGALPVRIRYKKNVRALTRELDCSRLATRVYPRGGEQDGFALTIAGALWPILDVDPYTNRVQLDDYPIAFADQLNGLQARKYGTTADVEVLATFLDTQEVELASVANLEVGNYIQFRDPDGNELIYMDWPAAIAAWGYWAPPDAVEASDVPPVDNLLGTPFLDDWTGVTLAGWAAVGGGVLAPVTDRLFHRYGIAAALVTCAADGDGIESDWHIVAPVGPVLDSAGNVIGEGSPYFTIQLALWIARGTIRLELDVDTVGDGSAIITLPDDYEKASSNEAGVWIENLAMNADLHELGAKRVRVRVVQDGVDPATFYLDAAQLTQTHGGALTFYDRRASNELWRRGNLHLAEFGEPVATYNARPLDLYRLDPELFVADELIMGGPALVEDPDFPAVVRARLIWLHRKLTGAVETEVRVRNQSPALTRLQQADRERRRRRIGKPPPPTAPPFVPPPPGSTAGGTLSNLVITLVQDTDGLYWLQLAWSHNQMVEDDAVGRFTVDIEVDEGVPEVGFIPLTTGRSPKLEHDGANAVPLVGGYRHQRYPVPKDPASYYTFIYRVELHDATAVDPSRGVQRLEVTHSGYYLLA